MSAPVEPRTGFAPILPISPRILILGSMPSLRSLAQQQYYGHPRNRFWPLIAGLLEQPLPARYAERVAMLQAHHIALWDVLASCRRRGSADAAIQRDSEQPNPIDLLLRDHPSIRSVYFNGQTAATSFARHFPQLAVKCATLPSTSPANAAWSLPRLMTAWATILREPRPAEPE